MLLRNVANKMLCLAFLRPMLLGKLTVTCILLQLIATNLVYVSSLPPTFHTTHKHVSVPGGTHTNRMPSTPRTIYARKSSIANAEIIGATSLAAAAALLQANGLPLDEVGNNNNNNINDLIAGNSENLLLQQAAANSQIVNLTRHHDGDIFRTSGVSSCTSDTCVGLSSGTAGILQYSALQAEAAPLSAEGSKTLSRRHKRSSGRFDATIGNGKENCQCRCLPYLSTYREDLGICVDDIHECTLSPFVSGSSSEKIPFVFLPLRGQIIYPSREISFPEILTPVCAVTGAQYLTNNGWSDLRNPIDTDYPFRMFRDEGRTFLQWLGEPDLRQKMQGRLIVVHLVCRDMTLTLNSTTKKDQLMPPKNVFSPCVAFRVNGSPVKYFHNVSEVLFQAETTATLASTSDGMSTREYVVIGVCSLLLGLIYVSSVFLYIHMKKRKTRNQSHRRNSIDDLANEINYPKNDQVTFGAPFNRTGSIYSATSMGTSNEPRSRASIGSLKDDIGVVKNNPLLQHYPQLSDHHSGFVSDISNSNSECEMDGSFHDKIKHLQTAALVHPQMSGVNGSPLNMQTNGNNGHNNYNNNNGNDDSSDTATSGTQENECIPMENVSIVEDMLTEEKLENLRAMVNGNVRKKLYFNPAYFEPHLLMQPPPAAIEFLQKIREVIAIAKYKMAAKRFQPSLTFIPEENTVRSDSSSMYGCTAPKQSSECQGCASNRCSGHAKNCGDKRNSIEKWLETVTEGEKPLEKDQIHKNTNSESNPNIDEENNNQQANTPPSHPGGNNNRRPNVGPNSRTSPRKEITPPKQRPPPPPTPTGSRNQTQMNKTNNGQYGSNGTEHTKNAGRPIQLDTITQEGEQRSDSNHGQKVSIPVNRCYDNFASLSSTVTAYGFAGSEIYNNPKFNLHDSPNASQRSRSSSHRSKSPKKRLDALEQYATASTPTSLNSMDRQHYNMLRNMQKQQMIMEPHYDYNGSLRSNASFHLNIPTPDYDSTMEKKIRDIYNNTQSSGPSVPTPDYSTLSRKSLRQYQPPDSPIYRRKSPQYLIVDYETDSLERLEATKRKSSQSSSSPSSDVSSQLSPSLSTALPLEEELEISHTVYDKNDRFRKDGEAKKKLIKTNSNNSVPQQKEVGTRIKYDTPFRGSMTIEVEHEPQSDLERSTDSDQFEPDTLDRKPKKQSFCDVNAWAGYLNNSPPIRHHTNDLSSQQFESLPPTYTNVNRDSFILRNRSNSLNNQDEKFATRPTKPIFKRNESNTSGEEPIVCNFGSLRDIYETQAQLSRQNSQSSSCRCGNQLKSKAPYDNLTNEQGRLLTLEAKHTRRQQKVEASVPPPPQVVEITNVMPNKTTIKISTPKVNRSVNEKTELLVPTMEALVNNNNNKKYEVVAGKSLPKDGTNHDTDSSKNLYDDPKNYESSTPTSTRHTTVSKSKYTARSPPPPPPPANIFSSTTLTSQKSQASNGRNSNYINTEDDSVSNISGSTEITRVSDTVANSEFNGSCQNTLKTNSFDKTIKNVGTIEENPTDNEEKLPEIIKNLESPIAPKKIHNEKDFGAIFNAKITGLRTDYSLTKYLNRRKSSNATDDGNEDDKNSDFEADSQMEANNNNHNHLKNIDADNNKLDVLSISSRSNRSSSRLSDRTKEMYRNAGVPVGIAYPQRSSVGSAGSQPSTNTVQTVYRCEIEPVQLTHGMQIAMGLKDRAKKAKDLKNAWKKFVSMAASKFSPTHSPAPPFDKKATQILEAIERDEGISSLIDEHPQVSTPKSSFSAPTQQNYYEQRFGTRLTELDSGYMSADSGEVYRRSFYDRYNFKMRSGREQIIRVDTIEDNSEGGSVVYNGTGNTSRRNSLIENQRFEDLEHMGGPPQNDLHFNDGAISDADSDKTITDERKKRTSRNGNIYSSEDEHEHTPSYGSSETDGETNGEDMWESGAESIETHSVLYKNIRNH